MGKVEQQTEWPHDEGRPSRRLVRYCDVCGNSAISPDCAKPTLRLATGEFEPDSGGGVGSERTQDWDLCAECAQKIVHRLAQQHQVQVFAHKYLISMKYKSALKAGTTRD